MKRFTRKSIVEASYRMRNEEAIRKIAQREDLLRNDEFYGKPMEVKREKSRNPFKIGSLCLSILP